MKKRNQLQFILMVISIVFVVGIVIYFLAGELRFDVFKTTKDQKSAFNMYKVEMKESKDGYYVQYKDIVASSADIGDQGHYFRVTLTVETKDKKTAKEMEAMQDAAVSVIRDRMSTFRTSDVQEGSGRQFMKDSIQKDLDQLFGQGAVANIYFEGFLYQ